MKHFVLSIALSALVAVAVSATAQASYYHHRHHHYWHHGGGGSYRNYAVPAPPYGYLPAPFPYDYMPGGREWAIENDW